MEQPQIFKPETRIIEQVHRDNTKTYIPQFRGRSCFFWQEWYTINTREYRTEQGETWYQFWREDAFFMCDKVKSLEDAERRTAAFIAHVNKKRQRPYEREILSERIVK